MLTFSIAPHLFVESLRRLRYNIKAAQAFHSWPRRNISISGVEDGSFSCLRMGYHDSHYSQHCGSHAKGLYCDICLPMDIFRIYSCHLYWMLCFLQLICFSRKLAWF